MFKSIIIIILVYSSISWFTKILSYILHWYTYTHRQDIKMPTDSYVNWTTFWSIIIAICLAILYY